MLHIFNELNGYNQELKNVHPAELTNSHIDFYSLHPYVLFASKNITKDSFLKVISYCEGVFCFQH
jgi:hypothetical protein